MSCRANKRLVVFDCNIVGRDHLQITELNLLRLNTLGRLFVESDGRRLTGAAAQPRRLALLALLAAAGEQGRTRDQLLAMLWPETDEERARKGLNQAIYALRQEMGPDDVFLGTRELRLNPDIFTSDVATFSGAIKAGQLERAAAEYAGPFLDGFHVSEAPEFERWLEEERAGLARDYATALQRLARRAEEADDSIQAVEWWRRLAAQDPLNASVAVRLMQALVATGDRVGALQHARVYEVLLQQELDAPPDREVVAFAEQIRDQGVGSVQSPTSSEPPEVLPPPAVIPLPPPPPIIAASAGPTGVAKDGGFTRAVRRRTASVLGLAAVIGLVAVGGWMILRGSPREIRMGHTSRITAQPGLEVHPALSPDGKLVAFAAGPTGRMRVYVRQLAGGRTIAVADATPGDQHWPRWSPDGTRLSFVTDQAIYVVPALGGVAKPLVTPTESAPRFNAEGSLNDEGPGYLAWSPDGRKIAYAVGRTIEVRPISGGATTRIATAEEPHSINWSPDGSRLAFVLGNAAFVYALYAIGNIAPSALWIVSAAGGRPERLTEATSLNTSPVWMPDGRSVLFVSDRDGSRDLYRVTVDRPGRPIATPDRLTTGLTLHTIDLSRDGRVVLYTDFTEYANIWSLPIPSEGQASPAAAQPITTGHQRIEGLALSRDGRWLAFDSDRGGRQAIYRVPTSGGEPEPLSADSGDDFMPSWSPDGREIAYYGFRQGRRRLFVMPVEGDSSIAVAPDSANQRFPDWAPDGRHLVFHSDRTGRFELYTVNRGGDGRWGAPRQLTTAGGEEARWSPDGHAIVYVRSTGLWLISPEGGAPRLLIDTRDPTAPMKPLLAQWGPDGRTVYYKALEGDGRTSFWSIPIEGGTPRLLARFDDPERSSPRAEFATDGRRLYFTVAERESDIWQTELSAGGGARR
jgi:Tol biopolymer transport system component/DNA-binding SARP family transcriptional activator